MCISDTGGNAAPTIASGLEGIGSIHICGTFAKSCGVPERRLFPYYTLVYTIHGEGYYEDDLGMKAQLTPGDLLILFPDIGHTFGPLPGKTWGEAFIGFRGPVFDVWRSSGILSPSVRLIRLEPVDWWTARLKQVIAPSSNSRGELRRLAEVQTLLADILARRESTDVDARSAEWLERASELIHASADGPFVGEELGAAMGMSYGAFRKRYTRLAGESPRRAHTRRQFQRACAILEERSVQETADLLGFCDPYHFAHRFHQCVGMWPSEYRRRVGRSGEKQ